MRRAAVILLGLIVLISLAICAGAETTGQPDRRIAFEENRIYAGVRVGIDRRPRIERLSEDAPEKTNLIWQSTNSAVATVNAWGLVTTLTPGETLITVQAEDNPAITASYELYVVWPVEKMVPEVSEITLTLDPTGTRDETDLFYTYQPLDAWLGGVLWSSSNDAIASVDKTGHVKAEAPGDAVITAEAVMPQGCKKTAQARFRIHVYREAEVLSLSEKSVELRRSGTTNLKAEVWPADASDRRIVWTSSDPNVAKVLNGRITGMNSGTCEIRCASADGRLNATCQVTVSWPTHEVKLSQFSATLTPGEQLQISAKVYPADADDTSLIWASSNEQIASVDDRGTVTAVLGGDCVITCVPADGIGQGAQCGIHVRPFSIAEKEWTVDRMTGITIPVQWHCFDPIALELKTNTAFFRAIWDAQDNICIQPLKPGRGTLIVEPSESARDRIELKITVTKNAVTDPAGYLLMTYEDLLKDEPEIGTDGKILGKVLQRIEQPEQIILLVGTGGEDWSQDIFWVEHMPGDPAEKAMQGELVIVCGSYQGVYTYESAGGREISVPALKARQITIR